MRVAWIACVWLVGCGAAKERPASTFKPPLEIDRGVEIGAREAFGPLRRGMSGDEVKTQLGEPSRISVYVDPSTPGIAAENWFYPGAVCAMRGETAHGPWVVRGITVEAPFAYATNAGIHIGSSHDDVGRAYERGGGGYDSYLVGTWDDGLVFDFAADGTVEEMSLGPFTVVKEEPRPSASPHPVPGAARRAVAP